jgi:protocatechuate 3,4-dioxygenase beta subunit
MRRVSPMGFFIAVSLAAATFSQVPPTAVAPKPPAPARSTKPAPVTGLDVTVTDAAGKPVEGAFVIAIPVQGAYRPFGELAPEKVRSTLTGRDGKAKLESLPPGPWTVGVHARGFVEQSLKRVASGPLTVRLKKGGVITGVVRDGDARRPVAGARVGVVGGMLLPSAWSQDAAGNEATTDPSGRFRLEGIGRSPVTIQARARGFGRAERTDVRAGVSIEIFLFPGASVSGVVRDDAGRPVAGAEVRAEGDESWVAPPPERSDARGEFHMDGIQPGEYTVVGRAGGRAPGMAVAVVEPDGQASVSLTVSDGGYAIGRIVDAEGRPVPGRVRVESWNGRNLPAFASDALAAEARADGSFALGPLPLGSLGIAASAPRFSPRPVDAEVAARSQTVDLGEIALDPGLAIRGRVHDREDNGIAGAEVRATRHGAAGTPSEGEAASEADGGFFVGGLEAGSHDVWATAPGYAPAEATATSGGEPVDLVMDPGGEIAGRVVDADGSPVEDAHVSAEDESRLPGPGRFKSGRSDEGDGRFILRDVAAGKYSLLVRAGTRGEASVADVRVGAGRTTNVGTITLGGGGTLQGVVVDSGGNGIPGATVGAERDANRRYGQIQTQTGSTGAFELRGVPIGMVYVSASHPAYAPAPPVTATVDPDKEPAPVRIVLPRGGKIEGRALYRDGRPFVGGRVSWYAMDSRGCGVGGETAAIGPDGSFVLDHVPAGRTMVTLMAFTPASPMVYGSSTNILTSVASREVDVREAETSSVDLPLRDVVVAGHVTRGGLPEPGVLVSVMSAEGGSVMTWVGSSAGRPASAGPAPLAGTTRDDGSYELLVFTPGAAYVELHGGGQGYPARQVDIPDADRFELDLEIGSATVSGIVVDRDGGAPVAGASVVLRLEGGMGGSGGESAPDGRFTIAVEPGEYRLEARARDRQATSQSLSVGASGVTDLRIEMERGLEIRGRLLDVSGRPASGYLTLATAADGEGFGYDNSAADGGFRIGGLASKPYAIVGGSKLSGYALRPGVTPGGEPLVLTLQPAGRIAVHVIDPAGQPVKDAYPRVETVDGARVRMPGRSSGPTDANGIYELACPAGTVGVSVRTDAGSGQGTASVRPGEATSLTVVLEPTPPKQH